jgi:nitroreductase
MKDHFYHLVNIRRSVRRYLDKPVEKEITERILEAARLAPSACNAQPWSFIVVDLPDLKNRIADATSTRLIGMNHFTKQAPVHIIIVMEPANITSRLGSMIKNKHFPLMDIGIAAEHICLAAAAEGLGTCMIGWFDEAAVREILSIPRKSRPVLIITLGYPSGQETGNKRRKSFSEVVRYNSYQQQTFI